MYGFCEDDEGSIRREEGFELEQISDPIHYTATDGTRLGRKSQS